MKKSPSKEVSLFNQQAVSEPKETGIVEVVAVPDLMIQVSPEVENDLKAIGVTIEGSKIMVTMPEFEDQSSFKRPIFSSDKEFRGASAIKFFKKDDRIFMKVLKNPTKMNLNAGAVYYKIVPNSEAGATAQGAISQNDEKKLQQYGLTGQE